MQDERKRWLGVRRFRFVVCGLRVPGFRSPDCEFLATAIFGSWPARWARPIFTVVRVTGALRTCRPGSTHPEYRPDVAPAGRGTQDAVPLRGVAGLEGLPAGTMLKTPGPDITQGGIGEPAPIAGYRPLDAPMFEKNNRSSPRPAGTHAATQD